MLHIKVNYTSYFYYYYYAYEYCRNYEQLFKTRFNWRKLKTYLQKVKVYSILNTETKVLMHHNVASSHTIGRWHNVASALCYSCFYRVPQRKFAQLRATFFAFSSRILSRLSDFQLN